MITIWGLAGGRGSTRTVHAAHLPLVTTPRARRQSRRTLIGRSSCIWSKREKEQAGAPRLPPFAPDDHMATLSQQRSLPTPHFHRRSDEAYVSPDFPPC